MQVRSSWFCVVCGSATLLLMAGCAKKVDVPQSSDARMQSFAPAEIGNAAAAPTQAADTLAYEHTVQIELARELLGPRSKAIQDACRSTPQSGCALLDVSISSDEQVPSATIRMRLAPGAVDSLIELASEDGKVTNRNSHAEDLAEPVADTERQLALLTTHRGRLEELMKNKSLTVDQLITVSRELASVQSQIEQFSTTRANLRRRIDTDLLTINLAVPQGDLFAAQSPVLEALQSFWNEMKQALAQVITFIAVLLPWLLVLVPGVFLVRWLWRRAGHWLNRRERSSPAA